MAGLLLLVTVGLVGLASSSNAGGHEEQVSPQSALAAASGDPAPVSSGATTKRVPRVLELRGSAYTRGLQHGRELQAEIARIMSLWADDVRATSGQDPDVLIRRFLAETNFLPAIRKWTPALLDEVRGIADGSRQPFERTLAFQLVDELWVYLDRPTAGHCSALGVARKKNHPAYVAQNMDLEPFRDGFQVVLHIMGDAGAPEQFVFSSAGLIGVNGVNRRSIAIACNTLMELSAAVDGLPVAFVVRGVLAQTRADEALAFVRRVRHASGQNYVLGVGDRVYDFEASAGKVVQFLPVADGSVVYHTNHALANDDVKPWHRAMRQAGDRSTGSSATRLASLESRLGRPATEINEDVIRETLRSKDSARHPVCRTLEPGATSFTFGATIMTLSKRPSLAVTMGPPDANPFERLEFATIAPRPGTSASAPSPLVSAETPEERHVP